MKFRTRDCITSYILLFLSILLYIGSFSTRQILILVAGPGFMPKLLSVLMLILGVALFIREQINIKRNPESFRTDSAPRAPAMPWHLQLTERYGHYTLWCFMLLYSLVIGRVGFIISSACLLFASFWILSPRNGKRPLLFAALSAGISLFIYYLFTKVFLLMLPIGILG